MRKVIEEYYCDSCGNKMESEENLNYVNLKFQDEKCVCHRGDIVSRFYIIGKKKGFCSDCYSKYRKTIDDFISSLAELGIKQENIYEEKEEEDDLV